MKNYHRRNFIKGINKSITDNQVISTLQAINDDWRLDAKQEDAHYFCMIDEVADVKLGKKCPRLELTRNPEHGTQNGTTFTNH